MRFTEHFGVTRTSKDEWFDVLMHEDTRLFVDPFRVAVENGRAGVWHGAHDEIVAFFNQVLQLLLKAGADPSSGHRKKADQLLDFPEPAEFCLGYAEGTTTGSGSGAGIGREMVTAARAAIAAGLLRVEAFEELVLIKGGVGADRIGDIVCNVLKHRFVEYTRAVCLRHGIATEPVKVRHASWSDRFLRWEDQVVDLPINPNNGRGVLLSPSRFLRDLPVVNPGAFWAYAHNENETLRNDFNYELGAKVDREEIARLARRHPEAVRSYVQHLWSTGAEPYDVDQDPKYEVRWWEDGKHIAERASALEADPRADFTGWVGELVEVFRQSVEKQGDWELLWSGSRPVAERKCQRLFSSVVRHYCRANDVDLSPESNAGRGPVDFKFSAGWSRRALLEMKLAGNSRLMAGIEKQLPAYQDAEEVHAGFLLVIRFRDDDRSKEKQKLVNDARDALKSVAGREIAVVWVDARPKASASKL